jgi:hypothetical protein
MNADASVLATFDRAPTCANLAGLGTPHDTPLSVALACSDPDSGDTLTYAVVLGPSHGTLGAVDGTGHVVYTPAAGYSGSDSFTYEATDNHGVASGLATATIAVGAIPAPSCANVALAVAHNTARSVALPCSHASLGALLWAVVTSPAHGTLGAIDASGNVTYTPKLKYHGEDSFTYHATDSRGVVSNTATVSITVGRDRPPRCRRQTVKVGLDTPQKVTLQCTDPDPRDVLRLRIVSKPSHGKLGRIDRRGRVSYTPRLGYFGADSFTFRAIDAEGAKSATKTMSLTVKRTFKARRAARLAAVFWIRPRVPTVPVSPWSGPLVWTGVP